MIYKEHGKVNQQWDIVYVDEYPEEPKKGELNEDFGIFVERDFYVVSQMSANRYLDLVGTNMVIKTPSLARKSQVWYFDQRSYTIKTRVNNKSWDIKSAGKTN
jgi:hypothetical protein